MGPEFFQSHQGQKFYGADVPHLIEAINRLAEAIEQSNALLSGGREVDAKAEDTADGE